MIDIRQRLQTLFEKHRLIFWYDDDGALREAFESVEIDGVKKLVIDGNEFGIKKRVLRDEPSQKFLIYSPAKAPADEENWLLDLNIANYLFAADKASLVLQNLGLDVGFKSFVAGYERFFNAPSRVESLREMISDGEDETSLVRKMMAVSIGCEENIESITLRVLSDEKHLKTLEKYGLNTPFFNALRKKFAYTGERLNDLLHKLMLNHFYYAVDKSKCPLNSDARLFVRSWMDSSRYKKYFVEASRRVADELNIRQIIEEADVRLLQTCDTFKRCDQAVIATLLSGLHQGQIDAEEMERVVEERRHTFWYGEYENIYRALLNAAALFDFVKKNTFKIQSFEEGIETYSTHWYKADRYYRDYVLHASHAEHLELLKKLNEKVEDVYLNGFLRELGDTWQPFAQDYTLRTSVPHQQHFYRENIEPLLRKKQKAVVIISDALRYECGMELASRINGMNRYTADCKPMTGSLPSYTQLGMASLLPHRQLSISTKNDLVSVDGISSAGTANREKILKSYDNDAKAVGYESFLKFDRDEGRAFVKNSSVIYIYHDEIDKMGEKNEARTFDAVRSTFETLVKIVKQVSNFNGSNIFITADHGFLYTNRPTQESEFCQVESEGSIRLNRRFVIGRGLKENLCTSRFDAAQLGIESDNVFLVANSINKIRVQGGGNRFVHGGATLQELVVPLLRIKKRRASDTTEVNVEIIPLRNVSTNTVTVALYQSEAVDEKTKPITLKVAFESIDGVLLSDEVKHTFDSQEQYDTNRETRFKLTFRQDIDAYNNQTIRLVTRKVLSQSSETPVYKSLDVKLSLSIFNDFDDEF